MPLQTIAPTSATVLLDMLTYRRPAGSKTERRFIREFIEPLGVTRDAFGNLYKLIGQYPHILYSCHTDTVHREGGRQLVEVASGIAMLPRTSGSNCLGADDTAGCWLMREMILAGVPGLYVFHRAEEIGGQGSAHIADVTPELLRGIKSAIAFDRRGTVDIITHQAGGRCCSDAFARSLGVAIGLGHEPSTRGTFTDTANYTDLVGECTNVAIGYQNEHGRNESLDLAHASRLRDAMVRFDASGLVFERQPGDFEYEPRTGRSAAWSWIDDFDQEPRQRRPSLVSLVRDHPDEVADVLEAFGITAEGLMEEISMRGGFVN